MKIFFTVLLSKTYKYEFHSKTSQDVRNYPRFFIKNAVHQQRCNVVNRTPQGLNGATMARPVTGRMIGYCERCGKKMCLATGRPCGPIERDLRNIEKPRRRHRADEIPYSDLPAADRHGWDADVYGAKG